MPSDTDISCIWLKVRRHADAGRASASAVKTEKKDTYSWHQCNYSQYSEPIQAQNQNR